MPKSRNTLLISLIILLGALMGLPAGTKGRNATEIYYIRLDMTSSNHKIIDQRLTMVPAQNDYRAEAFSVQSVSQTITADRQVSDHTLENLAKREAFMEILEQNGLKSVSTLDHTTVISYEGMVRTPIDLQIGPYEEALAGYSFSAQTRFAPVAFPDRWESMKKDFQIKQLLNDFILLFK